MSELTVRDLNSLDFWNKVLDNIRERISKPSYDTWIAPITAQIEDEDLLVIIAPNEFAKDWIEVRYKELLFEMVRKVAGKTFEIEVINLDEVRNITQSSMGLDRRQVLGYFLLACNETNIPKNTIKELYKNMCWQFDMITPDEAEKEGFKWYRELEKDK